MGKAVGDGDEIGKKAKKATCEGERFQGNFPLL